MKEAGRSTSATRSMGSVATIGRIGNSEGAARISAPAIGRPVNPGLRINTYIAPGISNRKFGIPEGFRVSPVQSKTIDVNGAKNPGFRPLEVPNNKMPDHRGPERHNHRRMPRQAYHETHSTVPKATATIEDVRSELTYIPHAKPGFSEPVIFGEISTKRKITAEVPKTPLPKKINATESSAWENKLFRKTDLKAKIIEISNTQSTVNRRTIDAHSLESRLYIQPRIAEVTEIPEIQKLRFARQNSLNWQEASTRAIVDIDEESAQKKKGIISAPRLSRVRLLSDEDPDLEENTLLKTTPATEIKSQKDVKLSKKQKLKEMILRAFNKAPNTTDNNDNEQKEDDEKKFGIDASTNKARTSTIAALRAYVTKASALIGIEPNWRDVANLFYKLRNKSLKSELVRDLNREDGTIKKITTELKHKGVIFPDARVDRVISAHPAVTAPRKHVTVKATERNVAEVMDLSDYDQAA